MFCLCKQLVNYCYLCCHYITVMYCYKTYCSSVEKSVANRLALTSCCPGNFTIHLLLSHEYETSHCQLPCSLTPGPLSNAMSMYLCSDWIKVESNCYNVTLWQITTSLQRGSFARLNNQCVLVPIANTRH